MHTQLQMHDFMIKSVLFKMGPSKPLIQQLDCVLGKEKQLKVVHSR